MGLQIKELRMKLTPDDIKMIMAKFEVSAVEEKENFIIFPTACHNLSGGSPKLYYYKNEKMFRCYTECNSMFDVFDLIMKMSKLRGNAITLGEAIKISGVDNENTVSADVYKDLEYLKKLTSKPIETEDTATHILDKICLERYPFVLGGMQKWLDEGIPEGVLRKYNIRYHSFYNAIVIPNYDIDGNLIGIRGRFLNPDAPAKYMPIKYGETIYSHPTSKHLYALNLNKEHIRRKKIAIIFEGEKSVMKMESFYPGNNISVATLGKNITLDHLELLIPLGITEVILGYDKDYTTKEEMKEKLKEYDKRISILKPYFQVSIIMDTENKLGYKDSPADKGKEVFDELLKYRMKR